MVPKKEQGLVVGDGERPLPGVQPGSGWVVEIIWGPGVLWVDPAPALLMGRLKGMEAPIMASQAQKTMVKWPKMPQNGG